MGENARFKTDRLTETASGRSRVMYSRGLQAGDTQASRVLPQGFHSHRLQTPLVAWRVSETLTEGGLPQPSCDKSRSWSRTRGRKAVTAMPAVPASTGTLACSTGPGRETSALGQAWSSLSRAFPEAAPQSGPAKRRVEPRFRLPGAHHVTMRRQMAGLPPLRWFLTGLATEASDHPTWGLFLGGFFRSCCCSIPPPTLALHAQCTRLRHAQRPDGRTPSGPAS